MSAIAGIVSLSGKPIDASLIDRLTLSMTARGPDRRQTWQTERVALGHCLLRTTPEALHEEQPMASVDGHLRIVFDGRLDNRTELFRELWSRNVAIRDETDAALVLAAYELWGEKAPERLLGDFAFAIWDSRQNKVFCARDHIGNRPCYYVQTPDFFAFASEDDPLVAVPGVSNAPNDLMVASGYVLELWPSMTEYNWLRDVNVLMPGRSVSVHLHSATVSWSTYWTPAIHETVNYSSIGEAIKAFQSVFKEAVLARSRSNGPAATLLSGGMDSASIAATLAGLRKEGCIGPIHAYSALHDHPEGCVESRKILALARACSDVHHVQSLPSFTGKLDFAAFASVMYDKPHAVDSSMPIIAMMCMMAQQNGQRVLLHGASGDCCSELGPSYLEHYARTMKLVDFWRECAHASDHHPYLVGQSRVKLMLAATTRAALPTRTRLRLRRAKRHWQRDPVAASSISERLAAELGIHKRLADLSEATPVNDPYSIAGRRMNAMFPLGILHGLEAYERIAGRVGVEMRDPYADRRVVEFFLTLPKELLVRNGWTKYLVRRSFSHTLPDEVVWSSDKSHLGWVAIGALSQSGVKRMRSVGTPVLAAFERYFNSRYFAQAKAIFSGSLAVESLSQRQRYDFTSERLPLALWVAGLESNL